MKTAIAIAAHPDDIELMMAGTLLLVIPMVLLFAGFQKYFIRGIAVQGRKG